MLTALLGLPTEQQTSGDTITLRYLCRSDAADGKGKDIDLRLIFDTRTDALLQTIGRMPFGNVDMKFSGPPAKTSPSLSAPTPKSAQPAVKN